MQYAMQCNALCLKGIRATTARAQLEPATMAASPHFNFVAAELPQGDYWLRRRSFSAARAHPNGLARRWGAGFEVRTPAARRNPLEALRFASGHPTRPINQGSIGLHQPYTGACAGWVGSARLPPTEGWHHRRKAAGAPVWVIPRPK
jgi:hypothetical protein